jgi:uncharacterized beta-barrel protein YwiB (DUF1934 family)
MIVLDILEQYNNCAPHLQADSFELPGPSVYSSNKNKRTTGEGLMPEKTSVSIDFRIRRPDGGDERMTAAGELYRMATGWAVVCRISSSADGTVTLVVRESEIRMNRKGAVAQEQLFHVGERRTGILATPYGTLTAETLTHNIEIDLSLSGGIVEWEYDLEVMGEKFEHCSIKLDIREEQMQ